MRPRCRTEPGSTRTILRFSGTVPAISPTSLQPAATRSGKKARKRRRSSPRSICSILPNAKISRLTPTARASRYSSSPDGFKSARSKRQPKRISTKRAITIGTVFICGTRARWAGRSPKSKRPHASISKARLGYTIIAKSAIRTAISEAATPNAHSKYRIRFISFPRAADPRPSSSPTKVGDRALARWKGRRR
jgi:hypothetical protein